MKKWAIIMLAFIAACTKNTDVYIKPQPAQNKVLESCDFGIKVYNQTKRPPVSSADAYRVRPKADPTVTSSSVILLDFDGYLVSGTSWNVNGDINCAPANLTSDQISRIINRVTEDYRPFNVAVTTDEAVYNAADPYKRMRVVITETWEWYGQTGGVSYNGSFTWGDNTPCFVFSMLLNYNEKQIAEAVSHEVGHTLGLRHQASYDQNCVCTNQYNYGTGSGTIGWAPIMGASYYENLTTWYNGPNPYGCSYLQDDESIISGVLGYKADDYGNVTNSATSISGATDGIINNPTDVDFFAVKLPATTTISITPFSLGNGEGANLDLLMKIYDAKGNLLSVADDPNLLSASAVLATGTYYISVETEANAYAIRYGMLGKYSIQFN